MLFIYFQINYSDASYGEPTKSSLNSTLVNDNPFIIQNLFPGHKYMVEFLAQPVGAQNVVGIGATMEMTDPIAPKIRPNMTIVDTNSIHLHGEKVPEALQDYFVISYVQLDSSSTSSAHDIINVTDIKEQKTVDFLIPNLNAGRNYNISITPFRVNRSGQTYREIIATGKKS